MLEWTIENVVPRKDEFGMFFDEKITFSAGKSFFDRKIEFYAQFATYELPTGISQTHLNTFVSQFAKFEEIPSIWGAE